MMKRLLVSSAAVLLLWAGAASASVDEPRARLLEIITEYEPGSPVTPELDARISAVAEELEKVAGTPDLTNRLDDLDGIWMTVYDTRNLLYEVNLKFMSGGQFPAAPVRVTMTTQELHPAQGFYRNTMVMSVGEAGIPFHYLATATLGLKEGTTNVFDVGFDRFDFVPADGRYTAQDLRDALGLKPDQSLVLQMPPDRPVSNSTVTYLDDDLRINRGQAYIAIMRKLR